MSNWIVLLYAFAGTVLFALSRGLYLACEDKKLLYYDPADPAFRIARRFAFLFSVVSMVLGMVMLILFGAGAMSMLLGTRLV